MNDVGLEIARHHRQEDRPRERARYEKRASGHDLGRSLADRAAAEPCDDGRRKRQENERLNHWGDQPFIMLISSNAVVQIGGGQVCTPVTNAHLVSRLLTETKT